MTVDLQANPFIVLTLIVAPAVLTNASAVLVMSTSNRFARTIDRARELASRLDNISDRKSPLFRRLVEEIAYSRTRSLLLLKAMRCFYLALGAFALVAIVSLLGAGLAASPAAWVSSALVVFAAISGITAVGGLVYGSMLLLRETRIVVSVLKKRIDNIQGMDVIQKGEEI